MKEIINIMLSAAKEELERANEKNPLFHSDHEGVAIIEEEKIEAKEEFAKMNTSLWWVKNCTYHDRPEQAKDNVVKLKMHAIKCAAELIQVAAMCDKFVISGEKRNED